MRISDWSSDVCSSDLVCMDRGLDLAVAGERQCLEQIEPRADDRASHGNAVQHGVEDRQREVARRQTIERDRAEIGRAQSELQSLMRISYAVFCLKKKKKRRQRQ